MSAAHNIFQLKNIESIDGVSWPPGLPNRSLRADLTMEGSHRFSAKIHNCDRKHQHISRSVKGEVESFKFFLRFSICSPDVRYEGF